MDEKENFSAHPSRKSWIPQLVRKFVTSNSTAHNTSISEGLAGGKEEGFTMELLPKMEEINGKKKKNNSSDGALCLRPNTVSGGSRKKPEFGEKDRSPTGMLTRKSLSAQFKKSSYDRRSIDSPSSTPNGKDNKESSMKCGEKTPPKTRGGTGGVEDFEATSLLSRAIYEHGQMMETLRAAREELRKKMVSKIKSKSDGERKTSAPKSETGCSFLETSNSSNFESCYSGVLEEIFQAWVNLFYFIINLKVGLIRVFDCAGIKSFAPAQRIEEEIIGKAMECVKFFSCLKMKSLVCSLDELCFPDDYNVTEKQIIDYEERISSPFLCEMDFVQKKAKEILKEAKKQEIN